MDSEYGQKVPNMQEMQELLKRQNDVTGNGDGRKIDNEDNTLNSELGSPKVSSTPMLSPEYQVEVNESFQRVYIPGNITVENASPVPMQLVEKTVQSKADINASFSSTSSEAVSIPSIPETDTDNDSV